MDLAEAIDYCQSHGYWVCRNDALHVILVIAFIIYVGTICWFLWKESRSVVKNDKEKGGET